MLPTSKKRFISCKVPTTNLLAPEFFVKDAYAFALVGDPYRRPYDVSLPKTLNFLRSTILGAEETYRCHIPSQRQDERFTTIG